MNQIVRITARIPQPPASKMPAEQWRVLTDAIFPAAKSAEAICLAIDYCASRRLDIFKRPVHIVPMYNAALKKEVETVWPGINELQVTAARTGQWAGMDAPEWGPTLTRTFEGDTGVGVDKRHHKVTVNFPEWCSVTVYRMINGQRCPFAEPVYSGKVVRPDEQMVRGAQCHMAEAGSWPVAQERQGRFVACGVPRRDGE